MNIQVRQKNCFKEKKNIMYTISVLSFAKTFAAQKPLKLSKGTLESFSDTDIINVLVSFVCAKCISHPVLWQVIQKVLPWVIDFDHVWPNLLCALDLMLTARLNIFFCYRACSTFNWISKMLPCSFKFSKASETSVAFFLVSNFVTDQFFYCVI